ncbi:MAG: hypothetical protein JSR48_09655 [Verrucomicrobia bacterium]|nr:hypothetical protein [Verrucomicrobiota bacterium]
MSDSPTKYTAKDWDEVRAAFASSIMVKTPLSSLAQNLDGPDWPVKGKDETPAAYIDLGYDEMVTMLTMKGMAAGKADFLISLLKETLAFDNPFGDMVEQAQASSAKDNQLLKNLAKLGIAEPFPIELTALSDDTKEFCKLEKLSTLGEFCVFAQDMSQNVIVGGDFRRLLNALSHIDEDTLTELLPFRKGTRGLQLLEALVQLSRSASPAARAPKVAEWFKADLAALQKDLSSGGSLTRHLVVLGNPDAEKRATEMYYLVTTGKTAKKGGLFGSLGRLFGK